MKQLIALMFFMTFFAHASDTEPEASTYRPLRQGIVAHSTFLPIRFSSGDLSKAEYWAQKAADNGDADACALLAQIKITNPVSLDYPRLKRWRKKQPKQAVKRENLPGADSGQHQAGRTDYPKAITLLQNASEDLEMTPPSTHKCCSA